MKNYSKDIYPTFPYKTIRSTVSYTDRFKEKTNEYMGLIINVLVTGFAVWLASAILPGVTVRNFLTAIWVGILIGLISATLGFILRFITIPINWLTLGLAHFLINVLMIMLVDKIVKGFHIKNIWWAILFALLISAINGIVYWII